MRVIHVIDTLNIGGAERVSVMLANLLIDHGVNTSFLVFKKEGTLLNTLDSRLPLIDLNRKIKWNLLTVRKLSLILSEFDIVHIHMRHVLRYVIFSRLLFRFKAQIVFHDHFNQYPVSFFKVFQYKYLLKNCVYVTVEEKGVLWAIQTLRLVKENVFKLSNIIQRSSLPSSSQKSGNHLVLVSNIKEEKNILYAVELIFALKRDIPDIHLTIYGVVYDKQYMEIIEQKIKDLELSMAIMFVHDCTAIQAELFKFSLGLHVSKKETGPLVLAEYLSQGLPFLSFSTGEIFERLNRHIPDFFIDNFNTKEWCGRIQQLLVMSYNKSQLTELFESVNSPEKYLQQCLSIYLKIY